MLRNFLKITRRTFAAGKAFSLINIFGLAIGLATCLLITLYILDESSYDRQHRNGDLIYRVASKVKGAGTGGTEEVWAAAPAPMAWAMKSDLPEVEQATRLFKFPNMDKVLLKYEPKDPRGFFESNGYYVDSTFFRMFTYDFTHGNAATALDRPNSLVISDETAAKLFGKEDPLGKPVKINLPFGEFTYTVGGVFKNAGVKSHIPAHFFLSMHNGDIGSWIAQLNNWASNSIFHTYIQLKPGVDPVKFGQKLKPFFDRRGGGDMKVLAVSKTLFLQPLRDIYLRSDIGYEIAPNGNIKYLYILGSIAVFILFIACINFMNLATARSEKRAREVGVRKVMGAGKTSLILQFMGESFLMCLIALVLSMLMAWLFLPVFNGFVRKDLSLFDKPALWGWMTAFTLFTGLLSGLYPAFYLSSFKPVSVLKGRIIHHFSAAAIRKGLVVFQFTVSVSLVLAAIIIWRQLDFMESQDLGFNKGKQIVLPLQTQTAARNYTALRNELLKDPGIRMVANGSSYPGITNINDLLFYADGKRPDEYVDIRTATAGNDYFNVLGLTLLYGRTFSPDEREDSSSIILNEKAVRQLGYEPATAIGKRIHYDWQAVHHTLEIIGVLKDFNFESLQNTIKPIGFGRSPFFGNPYSYAMATVQTKDFHSLLKRIEAAWNKVNQATPFAYSFMDLDFQKNYEKEQLTARIIINFTVMAIFIACLGLLGLAAFSAERRTREIGIRKVLGASVTDVMTLVSRDFLLLVFIAIVIASPLSWYIMNKWLENFAYRAPVSVWMFVAAGLVAILTALLTVSFQSIKAALANPVKSLRTE